MASNGAASHLSSVGWFSTNETTNSFIYHPTLNVIVLITKDSKIKVVDLHSSQTLHHGPAPNSDVFGAYLPGVDKLLLCDGRAVGVRRDHSGTLLLESILQPPVVRGEDTVKLDIPLSEATVLAQALKQVDMSALLPLAEDAAVAARVQETLQHSLDTLDTDRIACNPKAVKWCTVCLDLPLNQLRSVFSALLAELLRAGRHVPALAYAAAAVERLHLTLAGGEPASGAGHPPQPDRRRMFSEAARRQTFTRWPHMHYKWALPDQMAQAGFYHQPNQSGDDMAMCFTCTACLVCWEPTDEPWSEHERHSPACPFVKGEHTENVALSVTESTEPAQLQDTAADEPVSLLAPSTVPHLVATGTRLGHVVVWGVSATLTRELAFRVDTSDPLIEPATTLAARERPATAFSADDHTAAREPAPVEREARVGALCLLAPPEESSPAPAAADSSTAAARPCLVAGVRLWRRQPTDAGGRADSESTSTRVTVDTVLSSDVTGEESVDAEPPGYPHRPCLLVYDIKQQVAASGQPRSLAADASVYSHPGGGHTKKLSAPPAAPDPDAFAAAADKDSEFSDTLMKFLMNKDELLSAPAVGADSVSAPAAAGQTAATGEVAPPGCEPPSLLQCVPLPRAVAAAGLSVTSLQPSADGGQLLVLAAAEPGPDLLTSGGGGGALLMYPLETAGAAVTLRPLPSVLRLYGRGQPHPVHVTVIPAEVRPFPEDEPPELDEGQLAVLLSSGELQLLSAATLETLVSLIPPGSRCLGTAYCNSLDCLIACNESGELKFVPLSLPGMSAAEGSPGASRSAQANHMVDLQPPPASLVTQQPLSAAALTRAHELTRMETMTPLFSALVPPCWAEIQQAQKQRRHPRLMQSDRHHTRTWRLLNDGPAWKQHVFEITLPRSAPVAHVDFRFALQPLCTTMPHVQATLVRSSALPRQPGATAAAADDDDAGADDAEVMCGPVDLRTCLDMSGQGGTATFTSTELLRAHQRTFSLRLSCAADAATPKASGDGGERSGAFFLPDLQAAVYGSAPVTVDKLAAAGVKADHITGCECFQEVSITIRRVKLSHLPHQRVQRTAMLEQSEYHASLLDAVCRRAHLDDPLYCQNVALDVLLWVAALRLMHNASTERTAPFVSQVEERLHDLVSACFLHGSRTVAHKCARLIVLCIEASRGVDFGLDLFSTLVSFVPSTPGFQSPGALGWYFVLLNHTKRLMPQQAAAALMSLLAQVTRQLGTRADPLHDVLKTRYGLHGAPLEGELFDAESPCVAGETPPPATGAPAGETPESALEPDLRDLLGPCAPGRSVGQTGRAGVWSALAADEQLRGLVEVEPLHYTCHATSDCTRLEWQPGAVPARLLAAGQQLAGHRDGLSTAKLEEAIADVEKKAAELQALVTQKPDQASGHLLHILQHVSREVAGARRLTEQLESSLTDDQQPETEPPASASASASSAAAAHQLTDPMLSVLLSPWHHLLSPPSQHLLVIDRMHSGARRFVVIDFGAPVLLTDIIMPACADLLSISVDAWTQHEEADGQRLVVASDIGYRRLVMTGLQPPPVCRYLKITTIGRYGMTTTRCRIPMAWFYGRTVQMPWEVPDLTKRVRAVSREQAQAELGLLTTLYQEVHCQYSLACERLRRLLQALPPAADGAAPAPAASGDKVPAAYQECVTLQQQTAVVQSLVRRLRQYCRPAPVTVGGAAARLRAASTSQLRRVCDHLLESLLSLTPDPAVTVQRAPATPLPALTPPLCRLLFSELCVHAAPRQQLAAGALLLAAASAQPWWGQLVADMFSRLFTHSEDRDFPRQRLFILLTYMGQRTMSRGGGQSRALLEALLGALCGHLAAEVVDLSLVEWMLLYLATLIETLVDSKETGRWRFLAGERALLRCNPGAASGRGYKGYRRRLLTRLKNHKQIDELLNVKKLTMGKSLASSNLIGFLVHSQPKSDCLKKKQFKYVKAGQGSDTRRDASTSTTDAGGGGGGGGGGPEPAAPVVGRDVALRLVRHLMERLLDSQLMVSPEMMMTGCKVVSWAAAAARPALGLCELVTPAQLDCLLRAASGTATVPLSWTGAWTGHTVQCFIQEVLLAERAHPAQWGGGGGSSSCSGPPEPPRAPAGPPPPETASAGDGSSAASSDGSGTPEDEEDDSPSPSNNAALSSSDKLEVHMFSADGGGPPFSTYYPFPALSEAAGGPPPPAPPPATSAQQAPAAGADTGGEMYSDASQEAGVCLLPPMVESDDDGDHLMLDDFMMDIFDASLGDKKPPLPSDAVKWGLIPAPGGSWSLSNAANNSGGLGKLGAGWLSHASGAAAAGGAGSSGGGGGGACVLDILKAPAGAGAGAADLAGCSTASDARLEVGLTAWPELRLRKMAALHTGAVLQAVSGSLPPVPPPPGQPEPAAAPEEAPRMRGQDLVADGLAVIQASLQYSATPASVESLLELWLALDCACTAGFQRALPVLLQSVRAAGRLSLRGWTLLFQALTARRSPDGPSARSNEQTADMLLSHDLVQAASPLGQVLIMFLTQSVADVPGKQECGATVCRWFDALLVSLMSVPAALRWSVMLLELLWIAAHAPGFPEPGAPLDALSRLVQRMLQLSYPGTELGSIVGLVQVIVSSVHRHLSASEQARCGRGAESGPPETAAETLLVDLLRLAALLVCVPLRPGTGQSGESAPPQTDELKACSGGGGGGSPSPAAAPRLPLRQLVVDRVLENSVIVEQLLLSASLVTVPPQETPERPDQEGPAAARPAGAALAAALDDLLSTLVTQSGDRKQLARAIVTYLASRAGGCPPRISQLLLNFFLKVVNTDSAVASTIRHRGLEAVFENLMLSCRAVTPASGGVTSQMMRHISQRQRRPAGSANGPLRRAATPAAAAANALAQANRLEDVDGLINVAPLSTITCSNPMALQPEVLVQPTAPHRRSRNPAWSHHFYAAEERAVELQVRLPCAVLLHQVQLQPHVSSLATCPSAVTVEVCSGGPGGPVCTSVPTAGLTFIGIELPRPTVATEVTVRLQRPADSNNLGLTQLRLLASTTFGTAPPGKADPASEECHLWLRLLDAALPSSADTETLDQLCGLPRLLERARALLAAAAARPDSAQRAGRLLLRLGRHKAELGLGLVRQLLRRPPAAGRQPVRLLYRLATTDDQFMANRVFELLTWVRESALGTDAAWPLGPLHASLVHCIAAILWKVASLSHEGVLLLIPTDLVTVVYDWCSRLPAGSRLKCALDWVLCALCHLQPPLLPPLLHTMGVMVTPGGRANATDDRKDMEAEACAAVSDDDKHGAAAPAAAPPLRLLPAERLELGAGQLATLACVLQAPAAALHAIDSGLLHAVLVQAVHGCCRELGGQDTASAAESAELDDLEEGLTDSDKQSRTGHQAAPGAAPASQMPALLSLLSAVCGEPCVRDWLSSDAAAVYWLSLPRLLAARPQRRLPAGLEPELLRLLARCCHGHPANQRRLAATVCDILAAQLEASAGCRPRLQGFTRRLVLRLLLESERVGVLLHQLPSAPETAGAHAQTAQHPRFWADQLVVVKTDITIASLLQTALGTEGSSSPAVKERPSRSDKEQKNQANAAVVAEVDGPLAPPPLPGHHYKAKQEKKYLKKVRRSADPLSEPVPPEARFELVDLELSDQPLPPTITLSQLMTVRAARLPSSSPPPFLCLALRQRGVPDWQSPPPSREEGETAAALLSAAAFPSVLSVFAEEGGLALLAGTLPLLFPEGAAPPPPPSAGRTDRPPPADLTDAEWVKVDQTEEDEYVSSLMPLSGGGGGGGAPAQAGGAALPPVMSPHSLACFGLFLRLPGYAELLLRDQVWARYLLRLALGVTDDGDGNEILRQGQSAELPLYPVQLMQRLLDATQLTTDDGQLLRRRCLEIGAVNFLLACTAVLSHTESAVPLPALEYQLILATTRNQLLSECQSQRVAEDRGHQYWAKGTGFGTGSTSQKWNVEQAMLKQKSEEEHVTWLIQTLASYINPGDAPAPADSPDCSTTDLLPEGLAERISESSILTAVCSYLRNDSVLDMARHVPLYRAILRLLRAFAGSRQLAPLLSQVAPLLANMRQVVDTYTSHLHSNKPRKGDKSSKSGAWPKEEEDGGLARLLATIQDTSRLVSAAAAAPCPPSPAADRDAAAGAAAAAAQAAKSLQDIYLETMRKLQFDTHEMIVESPNGGTRFVVSHHFESTMRAAGERSHPARMKRLAQETVTLSTSLPLSFSSSVFVRVDLGRLDLMKVLITAPSDTPYSNGCFLFDVYFPYDYPNAPMLINLDTTGRNTVRFNPNLYNDGKVCLSVLNTWHGRPEEKWSPQTSSFLQVLVSIQSLILVSEPYFNEPGYERSRGTPSGTQSSREYDANIRQATVRWAMLEQIRKPCPCFKEVIERHFFLKRGEIVEQVQSWIAEMEGYAADRRSSKTLHVSLQALKTHFAALQEELKKLRPPPDLEGILGSDSTPADAAGPPPAGVSPSASQEKPTVGLSPSARPPAGLNAIPDLATAGAAASGVIEKVKSAAAAVAAATDSPAARVNGVEPSGKR